MTEKYTGFHVTITKKDTGKTICDDDCAAFAIALATKRGGESRMGAQCGQEKLFTLLAMIYKIREEATELFATEFGKDHFEGTDEKVPLEKIKELVDEYLTDEFLASLDRRRLK